MSMSNERGKHRILPQASIKVFFILAMLLSIGGAVIAWRSAQSVEKNTLLSQHGQTVLLQLEKTQSTLRELVASARGYVISGDEDHLLRFETNRALLFNLMSKLKDLSIGHRERFNSVSQLNEAIVQRVELARTLIDENEQGQFASGDDFDRDLSEDIRKQFLALKMSEEASLAKYASDVSNSVRRTVVAVAGAGAVSIAMMIAVYLGFRREMSGRRQAESRADACAAQAEKDVEELNASLRRQTRNLGNVNKELESFAYSVSHDLRAPLRAISGYAMMVEEDYAEALDVRGKEQLQVIRRNVGKMDTLIGDLLKLSKSTTGEVTLTRFSMQAVVEKCIAGLPRAHGNVEFIVNPLDDVAASQVLLVQVWENLLDNAVKFSSKSDHPVVRVSSTATPDEVIYQVQDNGAGFDMRYVHKLFGAFQRLHRQEEFPGTGIGLALVQRIVIRHGGRVWAESGPGDGAGFFFALPRQTF